METSHPPPLFSFIKFKYNLECSYRNINIFDYFLGSSVKEGSGGVEHLKAAKVDLVSDEIPAISSFTHSSLRMDANDLWRKFHMSVDVSWLITRNEIYV
jgi:hypothetical protein